MIREILPFLVVSFFVRRRQFLLVRIDHEHGQQLRGFGLARILTKAVPVTGHLGEALPGAIRNHRPIIDRTSVNNGPVVTYRKGESFSEMPGDRHTVDENASKTEPAKLLAVFVVNTDEKELLTPLEK